MSRRSRQSELFDGTASHQFRPTSEWSRLSFLDLLGDDPHTPLTKLEPAYIDGGTLVAVWPEVGDLGRVEVLIWKPDLDTMRRLHQLQVDWPPALCDVRVRVDGARVQIRPCGSSTARRVRVSNTARGETLRYALDRGARTVGRPISLAA